MEPKYLTKANSSD